MQTARLNHRHRAFALLELIVATALFALAIAALGRATLYTVEAQTLIQETDLVRRAVTQTAEEMMASQEAPVDRTLELDGAFTGIQIEQRVENITLTGTSPSGDNQEQVSLLRVQLRGQTNQHQGEASYTLTFYVRR